MFLTIHIEYNTQWGEEISLIGSIPELGSYNEENAISLQTTNGLNWSISFNLKMSSKAAITYNFLVSKDGQIVRREESNLSHRLNINPKATKEIEVFDVWLDKPTKNIEAYSIYNKIWNPSIKKNIPTINSKSNVTIEAIFPKLQKNEELAIIGNHSSLGNWDIKRAVVLDTYDKPYYTHALELSKEDKPIEYKYILRDTDTKELIAWEEYDGNRVFNTEGIVLKKHLKVNNGCINFSANTIWKSAGVAVPIFSLRSKKSWGIGEFNDLKQLANWAKLNGLTVIQILPINDTIATLDWPDSYPYRCTSVFALNPIYLNLEELGIKETKYKEEYFNEQDKLNGLKSIDIPTVINRKLAYLEEIFHVKGEKVLATKEFKNFFASHNTWLEPYAAYKLLTSKFKSSNFNNWKAYATYSKELIVELLKKDPKTQFIYFTQFVLHKQLQEACSYANKQGIAIKGDLPIGISRSSVDAWQHPQLFNLENQAGAPPDAFAIQGQNWGFPTYNWTEMAKDNYAWWQKRLQHMNQYFSAYRIDHILGFFRIWSIPFQHTYGTLGQFDPALPYSTEELKAFNFKYDKSYSIPLITFEILKEAFQQEDVTDIINHFFIASGNGCYVFKDSYNSQRKISEDNKLSKKIKTILIDLHSNVLFVPDYKNNDLVHPRINGQNSSAYKALSHIQQLAYNELYDHFFYHRHNELWSDEAYRKLPALIRASDMLVCGEDLGMIPASVPKVMNSLSILSLEVARMPKDIHTTIANAKEYPYFSIATFSTHDMSTLRGLWTESSALRERYGYNENKVTDISPNLAKQVLLSELEGNAILCIEALQDWLSISKNYRKLTPQEEQINIPADSNHKWKYRIPCFIEDLIKDKELNQSIRDILAETNRI